MPNIYITTVHAQDISENHEINALSLDHTSKRRQFNTFEDSEQNGTT